MGSPADERIATDWHPRGRTTTGVGRVPEKRPAVGAQRLERRRRPPTVSRRVTVVLKRKRTPAASARAAQGRVNRWASPDSSSPQKSAPAIRARIGASAGSRAIASSAVSERRRRSRVGSSGGPRGRRPQKSPRIRIKVQDPASAAVVFGDARLCRSVEHPAAVQAPVPRGAGCCAPSGAAGIHGGRPGPRSTGAVPAAGRNSSGASSPCPSQFSIFRGAAGLAQGSEWLTDTWPPLARLVSRATPGWR